ncbi:MAG: MFS transporter [Proteobacteria bacterium]|nr:MFS transporter [Pseudomonadota bacterium]
MASGTTPLNARDPHAPLGTSRALLLVFAPFACGFFLSDFLRVVNALIAPRLVHELGLSAADLGFLTSAFFLTFAAAQLPLGLLLDRFDARRVQAALFFVAAIGCFLFHVGESATTLTLGRALMGLGMSGGLMSSFKAITLWFPPARWPLLNGCTLAIGGLGAMAATAPLEALFEIVHWREVFLGAGVAVLFVALAIFFVVPERRGRAKPTPLALQLAGLATVFRDREFWRVSPIVASALGSYMAILSLWAGPWLKDVAALERPDVAFYLLIGTASMAAGYASIGTLVTLLERRGQRLDRIMIVGAMLFMLVEAAIAFELDPTRLWMWAAFGVTGSMMTLAYVHLSRAFPLDLAGRVNTSLNVLVFTGAFAIQYGIGEIIDLWPSGPGGRYPAEAYRTGFGVFLALQAACLVWFFVPVRRPR